MSRKTIREKAMLRDRPPLPLVKQKGKVETKIDLIAHKTILSEWREWFQSIIFPESEFPVPRIRVSTRIAACMHESSA